MRHARTRVRRSAGLVAVCVLAVAAPAVAQSPDECTALNGVRYASPDDATTAQYVGVSGACNAAEEPDAQVEVVPVGGAPRAADGAPPMGGGATGSPRGGTQGGTEPGTVASPRSRRGDTTSPGRTTGGGTPAAEPNAHLDRAAEVRVAQALSTNDEVRARYVTGGGLISWPVGGVLVAALALVGAGIGLRRRPS